MCDFTENHLCNRACCTTYARPAGSWLQITWCTYLMTWPMMPTWWKWSCPTRRFICERRQEQSISSCGEMVVLHSTSQSFHSTVSSSTDVKMGYFSSQHGKSPCDSCGAVIKTAVDEDVVGEGLTIQNAESMYQHLMQHYSLPDPEQPAPDDCIHTKRSFRVIRKEDIDRSLPSSALKTVPGTD